MIRPPRESRHTIEQRSAKRREPVFDRLSDNATASPPEQPIALHTTQRLCEHFACDMIQPALEHPESKWPLAYGKQHVDGPLGADQRQGVVSCRRLPGALRLAAGGPFGGRRRDVSNYTNVARRRGGNRDFSGNRHSLWLGRK